MTTDIELDQNPTLEEQRHKAAKPLLWVGIAGMFMMFAGLTSGYVVSRSALIQDQRWFEFELPTYFMVSTVVVILVSVVYYLSVQAFKQNNISRGTNLIAVGFVLGLGFTVLQILGWISLYNSGVYFTGPGSNTAGSWVYIITFVHLLHVFAGLVASAVTMYKALSGKYNDKNYLGVELNAIYWHFVDFLWIYLFTFLSLIR